MFWVGVPILALAAVLAPVRVEATPVKRAADATVTGAASGNPFEGYQIYANPYYASEISASALPTMTGTAGDAAKKVADVGTFVWLDTAAKVPTMGEYLSNIKKINDGGSSPPTMGAFVVYDLPDRDCNAFASNGEYSIADDGVNKYKAYIDNISQQLDANPDVHTALIIEPDSLANLVTNMGTQKCANAHDAYIECVEYAITKLNKDNVAMYLDAGHAGWLGWPNNLQPAAELFAQVYKGAGSPAAVRGLATNVANYNAWTIATCPSYAQGSTNCDEKRYVNALAPLLVDQGFPAHFVTDTSRNGAQPTKQQVWGDFCNIMGTGFGVRPTTDTGDALEDAFVWIKPGGECDGTSDSSSPRFDSHCASSDALQPAPEAGTWFQAYFAQLVENASPAF